MLVQITTECLSSDAILRAVRSDECGAVTIFHGIVRNHNDGRGVLYLEYDAYPELAEHQLRIVAAEMLQRFDIADIAIAHRIGRVEIGEASLLVATASAHRAESFAACQAAVDRIKQTVPIWKREYWQGGGVWLEGTPVAGVQPAGERTA